MNHTHALDLFGGKKTKLNLLDGAQWRLGVREVNVRHDGGCSECEKLFGLWGVRRVPGETSSNAKEGKMKDLEVVKAQKLERQAESMTKRQEYTRRR